MVDGLQINVTSTDDFPRVKNSMVEYLKKYGKIVVLSLIHI